MILLGQKLLTSENTIIFFIRIGLNIKGKFANSYNFISAKLFTSEKNISSSSETV
jgi:hypothetical protein